MNKNGEENPIIALAEFVQKIHGESLRTKVLSKSGPDHTPTIEVGVYLPDHRIFKATGSNKRIAKRKACLMALNEV